MIGTLLKVLEPKVSRNGNTYIRLTFTLKNGTWAKTDVCPNFRNYQRWIPIMKAKPGSIIRGLTLRTDGEINADCYPEVTTEAKIEYQKKVKEEKEHKRAIRIAEQKTLL